VEVHTLAELTRHQMGTLKIPEGGERMIPTQASKASWVTWVPLLKAGFDSLVAGRWRGR
jgi:hypothetical protein